ncbi:ABC transporter ATP-binding protein [Morganella morganii]|uniref:ATP-binding cassette domain-containing protein n=1 Tax=Morganella morganii TaxID=582 RepID=UPI00128E40E7|nr:ABC transporter ATP-binding protein [Morganella morganii]MQC07058.1 ABC transporter ATP-binding protein [Morganella morganii]MQC12357.1 ABC transporter ATP-binding protein [Morganella morganii]MQC15201.1 ABC transporter ATP-binding protein [Morganella morganii]
MILDKLTVRIPLPQGGTVHAATDVCLTLVKGQIHALIGESGCGKSTIALAIMGLLTPSARVSGSITFMNENILGKQERLLGHHIALVPQSAATFLTSVRTVGSQLKETIKCLNGINTAETLLRQVDLTPDILDRYPHEISGGMAQRAALAFALAGDPEVIIADEPTASLDPERKNGILKLLRRIADRGKAIMLITHDISALMDTEAADTVSVCYASKIVENVDASRLYQGRVLSPYTKALLAALPRNGLHRMPGTTPELTNLPEDYSYDMRVGS